MKAFFDKLNLTTQERRLVIGIVVVLFIVVNVVWVWPRFNDWNTVKTEMGKSESTLARYQAKIQATQGPNGTEAKLKRLEGEAQNSSLADDQEIALYRNAETLLRECRVAYTSLAETPSTIAQTNEFFAEKVLRVPFRDTEEKDLIDFLYRVSSGNSLIRVRELTLKPAEQTRYRLGGTMVLVASYLRKAPVAVAPAPAGRPNAAAGTTNRPAANRPAPALTNRAIAVPGPKKP